MHSSAFLSELATFASAKTVWNNTASTKCQVQAAEKCFNLSLKLPQSIALQRDALEPVDPANARTAEFRRPINAGDRNQLSPLQGSAENTRGAIAVHARQGPSAQRRVEVDMPFRNDFGAVAHGREHN